jgi:hypothetical protein
MKTTSHKMLLCAAIAYWSQQKELSLESVMALNVAKFCSLICARFLTIVPGIKLGHQRVRSLARVNAKRTAPAISSS